jgi:hypothetical protein
MAQVIVFAAALPRRIGAIDAARVLIVCACAAAMILADHSAFFPV